MDENAQKISPEQNDPPPPPEKTPGREQDQEQETRFTVWQSQLAEKLGVSAWELRDLRDQHLQREIDFTIGENNHAVLTEAAAQKLVGLVMTSRDVNAAPVTLPAAALRACDVKMTVQRSWPLIPNPRLVEAVLSAGDGHHEAGAVVCVRVKNNRQWKRGDELTGRHFEGVLYDLTSRPPKRRGGTSL